jgi:hypothetical protein
MGSPLVRGRHDLRRIGNDRYFKQLREDLNMKKRSFTNNGKTWKRVPKNQACAAYVNGLTVAICQVNFVPKYPYTTNRKSRERFIIDDIGARNDFNNVVSSFEHYNCTNAKTGKYAAFYMEG